MTLRQVARLADVSNFAPHEWSGAAYQVADVQRKYEALGVTANKSAARTSRSCGLTYTPLLTLAEDGSSRRAQARGGPHPRCFVAPGTRLRYARGGNRALPGPRGRRRAVLLGVDEFRGRRDGAALRGRSGAGRPPARCRPPRRPTELAGQPTPAGLRPAGLSPACRARATDAGGCLRR